MKLPLYNQQAEKTGEVEVNSNIFGLKPNKHLMAEAVRVLMSNARTGLAHTKTRGDVRGGGKKPWKQKGTGKARAGSNRSPIWRHGGVTFGPRSNRNWSLKLNRKANTQALLMSLSDKVAGNKAFVVDKLEFPALKTKHGAEFVKAFEKTLSFGKRVLVVVPDGRSPLAKVFRNIPKTDVLSAKALNILDILKATDMVVLQDSLEVLNQTFKRAAEEKAKK